MKQLINPLSIALWLSILLAACAPGGSGTPTPTIVPLERTGLEPTQTVHPSPLPSTATPIPFPSATPTPTPMAEPVSAETIVTPSATSPASPARPRLEVVAYGLNIRQGPGLAYPKIGTASEGDRFDVLGTDPSRYWLQIETAAGESGWISGGADYSRLVSGQPAELPLVEPPASPDLVSQPLAGSNRSVSQPRSDDLAGRLVFNTGSGGELFVVNVDGRGLRRLAGGVIDPVVSPAGRQVAFTRWDGAEFGALYTVDIETGQERLLLNDIRQPKSPTWSPDGEQIVISFQHGGIRDPQRQCRTYRPGEEFRLPERIEILWVSSPRPDGSVEVCFRRLEDLRWMLRQVNVATGDFEDLSSDLYAFNPAWDPQQPWRVVYDGTRGLMQFDMVRDEQRPLTDDLRDTGPVFAPDGRRLALTYQQHDHWEVYTLDLESGTRQRLTKPPILADPQYNSAAPTWSPDGQHLAFVTNRTGQWEIWVMAADGSQQRPLFSPELQRQWALSYRGMNERMLNWID